MIALASVMIIVLISLIVTRIATVALIQTGPLAGNRAVPGALRPHGHRIHHD
jgi:hypothetical protein